MKISKIISAIKAYTRGIDALNGTNQPIDEKTTRDIVAYGSTNKECTGIATTCYASVDVIRKAHEQGINFIICHESLFWNHGDHTDWLEEQKNSVYLRKKALLDEYDMTVWRFHDYIHSGIPDGKGGWVDGIFKGFLYETRMDPYYVPAVRSPLQYSMPIILNFNGKKVREIADMIMDGANLNGIRLIGDPETEINYACIPMHIMFNDNDKITMIDKRKIDLVIAMELIDYTVNIYIRDGIQLGDNKAILTAGHFNTEELGMKYMLKWLPEVLETEIKSIYLQSGDANHYLIRECIS